MLKIIPKDLIEKLIFTSLKDGKEFLCEVKLTGSGNPENADAVIARATNVFVADKLSDQNKNQLDHLEINWVEMRHKNGFKRFKLALEKLGIPHMDLSENFKQNIETIFEKIFANAQELELMVSRMFQ